VAGSFDSAKGLTTDIAAVDQYLTNILDALAAA